MGSHYAYNIDPYIHIIIVVFIDCCVYRLTNILLYWYNTTGWLLSSWLVGWLVGWLATHFAVNGAPMNVAGGYW